MWWLKKWMFFDWDSSHNKVHYNNQWVMTDSRTRTKSQWNSKNKGRFTLAGNLGKIIGPYFRVCFKIKGDNLRKNNSNIGKDSMIYLSIGKVLPGKIYYEGALRTKLSLQTHTETGFSPWTILIKQKLM